MVKIDTSQINKVVLDISKLSEDIREVVSGELEDAAKEFVRLAKNDAPGNFGKLRNSISYTKHSDFEYEIFAQVSYAPYMEFGTKKYFKAIPGVDSSIYMGKGNGDIYDFLNAILDWVKRKGIHTEGLKETNKTRKEKGLKRITKDRSLERSAAAIAYFILKNGVKPHPFYYKQYDVVVPKLINRIQSLFK